MNWVLMETILLILIISTIFFILPIKLVINFKKNGENEEFYVKICIILGIFSYQVEFTLFKINLKWILPYILLQIEAEDTNGQPIHKAKINIEKPWNSFKKLIQVSPFYKASILLKLFKNIFELNNNFFKKVVCQKLVWKTSFGFSDPALTALSTGGIWAAKSIFYINLKNNFRVNFYKPVFEVNPIFNKKEFQIFFDCIFTFRFGHIIIAGYKILITIIKTLFAQRG